MQKVVWLSVTFCFMITAVVGFIEWVRKGGISNEVIFLMLCAICVMLCAIGTLTVIHTSGEKF